MAVIRVFGLARTLPAFKYVPEHGVLVIQSAEWFALECPGRGWSGTVEDLENREEGECARAAIVTHRSSDRLWTTRTAEAGYRGLKG